MHWSIYKRRNTHHKLFYYDKAVVNEKPIYNKKPVYHRKMFITCGTFE